MPTLMFINKESLDAIANKIRSILGKSSLTKYSVPSGMIDGIEDCNKKGKDDMLRKSYTTYDYRTESTKNALDWYGSYAFAGSNIKTAVLNPRQSYGEGIFYNCRNLTSVTWRDPDTDEVVPGKVGGGDSAFYFCEKLQEISLEGNAVKNSYIPGQMFFACVALRNVNLIGSPITISSIGTEAFRYCMSLPSFDFGGYINYIFSYAFESSGLTNVSINKTRGQTLEIYDGAFANCKDLTTVSIVFGGTTILHPNCFEGDTSLTTVTLPSGLTSIPDHCFDGCSSLTSIHIPASVTSIGEYAFNGCTSLAEIVFDGTPTIASIGQRAFMNCDSLVNFTVPASVTSIGAYAFADCDSLEYTRLLPTTPPTAGQYIFYTTINNPMTIYVPASVDNVVYNAYYNATNWKISSYRSRMAIWPES